MSDPWPQLHTFRFGAPWLLLALLLLPLWAWLRGRYGKVAAVEYSSAKLLRVASRASRFSRGRVLLMSRFLALALFICALARPQIEKGLTDREALGINIVPVLDFSGTMKTKDFQLDGKRVSRAEAMKKLIAEFIKARPSDRIGLVRFDASAALVSPLTLDHEWLLAQLANEEPTRGTAPGFGMLIAGETLLTAKLQTKVIITVTDADQINDGPRPEDVAKALVPLGIKNHVIHLVDYKAMQQYTASGETLKNVARITGGHFFQVADAGALRGVYRQIDQLEKSAFKENKQKSWRELMAFFAGPGALLLLAEMLLTQTIWRRLP